MAEVDDDRHDLAAFSWSPHSEGYACRKDDGRILLLHRAVLGLEYGDGVKVDHRDRNKLNNRRDNLRACTQAQNCQNLSPDGRGNSHFRGVWFWEARGKWVAYGKVNRRRKTIGYFDSEEEAAAAAAAWRAANMPYSDADRGGG